MTLGEVAVIAIMALGTAIGTAWIAGSNFRRQERINQELWQQLADLIQRSGRQ